MISRVKFWYFEDTLFSETFKVEENKVPSEIWFYVISHKKLYIADVEVV